MTKPAQPLREFTKRRSTCRGSINLTATGKAWLGNQIDSGKAEFVANGNRSGREVYDINWQGQMIRVIYDKPQKTVITILGFIP